MHRNQLRNLLEQYEPTAEEVHHKQAMLAFLAAHEDAFERSLKIGHFTASAWLVSKDGLQALLLHHAKLDMWVQPGGHADGESDLCAVAVKEAQEESGILGIIPMHDQIFDIDIHAIPASSQIPSHDHYDVRFLLKVMTDEQCIQNHESKELRWISVDAMDLPTEQRSVIRMFEKWQKLA